MAKVTDEQLSQLYRLSRACYDDDMRVKEAANELYSKHGMNESSAEMYINFFCNLMKGKKYEGSVSKKYVKFFMENVLQDYGKERLVVFLSGLEKSVNLKESTLRNNRRLHNEFNEKIGEPLIFESTPPYKPIDDETVDRGYQERIKELRDKAAEGVAFSASFSGKFFVRNRIENPRQVGSWGHIGYDYFEYAVPLSYEDFKRKGGRNNDLQWDIDHKYIAVFSTKEQAEAYCQKLRGKKTNTINGPSRNKFKDYTIRDITDDGCFIDASELENMFGILEEKKNLILQGPPGTGKTWLAKRLGYALIGKREVKNVTSVQFHPNMSYEDFVMGYRPSDAKNKSLERANGIFLKFAEKAKKNPNQNYVIVIEEINRGNPAQIFGELLTLLEKDKRKESEALRLSYQDENESFYIPDNLYVIGTMNLADRSLALMDIALRRRFAFTDLQPMLNENWHAWVTERLNGDGNFTDMIQAKINNLNDDIKNDPTLGKQFCIGHSYVTPHDSVADPRRWFIDIVKTEIVPLLEEYWFEHNEKVETARTALLENL